MILDANSNGVVTSGNSWMNLFFLTFPLLLLYSMPTVTSGLVRSSTTPGSEKDLDYLTVKDVNGCGVSSSLSSPPCVFLGYVYSINIVFPMTYMVLPTNPCGPSHQPLWSIPLISVVLPAVCGLSHQPLWSSLSNILLMYGLPYDIYGPSHQPLWSIPPTLVVHPIDICGPPCQTYS
jgi:hypothetical protein